MEKKTKGGLIAIVLFVIAWAALAAAKPSKEVMMSKCSPEIQKTD